jgi:hypothetical protein
VSGKERKKGRKGRKVERVRFSDEHGSPAHQNGRMEGREEWEGRKGRMEGWKSLS